MCMEAHSKMEHLYSHTSSKDSGIIHMDQQSSLRINMLTTSPNSHQAGKTLPMDTKATIARAQTVSHGRMRNCTKQRSSSPWAYRPKASSRV
jgi:hypothetical protein